MSRFSLFALTVTAALISSSALAGGGNAPGTGKAPQAQSQLAPNTVHKLQKTYFETANANGQALTAGSFTDLGTTLNVNCTNAAGCTVAITVSAQLQAAASSNNMALCLKVDGSTLACPYNQIIPAGSGFVMSHLNYFAEVPLGNHTVTGSVYTSVDTGLYRWVKETRAYKP